MPSPQIPVARVENEAEEEENGGDTKDGDLNNTDDCAGNRVDTHGWNESDQQTESDHSNKAQEGSEPISLLVFMRAARDEQDENDNFHYDVANDLSPRLIGSERDEGGSSDHSQNVRGEPEEVIFWSEGAVQNTDGVEPPVRGVQWGYCRGGR